MLGLRKYFLLDPAITFLNHGSFGATPRPVFQAYQRWQRELERQPVEFLGRRYSGLMNEARTALAGYLGSRRDNLVYVTNVTIAINIVARSLELCPGDEVLASDHEYGACDRIWRFMARQRGFTYINQPVPLPATTPEEFIAAFWKGVTPRTRVIFLSHITSPTALIFPIEAVCRRARQEGIITVIDGAHAPGQIPLNLETIGADFYGANLHKWLCAPKGTGFLYTRPDMQSRLEPLVVSWGYEAEKPGPSRFVDHHEFWGTRDISAFLSVPDAIRFQQEHDWEKVRQLCHGLAIQARDRICDLTGLASISPDTWFAQLVSVPLPVDLDPVQLKARLYDKYHIEIPIIQWNGRMFIRVGIQGYNTRRDVDNLTTALQSEGLVRHL